jgi:hypothetical protein
MGMKVSFFAVCPFTQGGLHGPEKWDEVPLGLELGAERHPAYEDSMPSSFIPFFGINVNAQ